MLDPHGVSLAGLAVFCEAARTGSLTAAAERLGYTQSAVSRQIAALERQAGAPLFDRLARGVRPTAEGRALLGHAEAVLGRLDEARRDLRALRELDGGRLRAGAFPTANIGLVPRALAALRTRHPGVDATAEEARTPELERRLGEGEVDIAVVSSTAGREPRGVRLVHLLDEGMYVAVAAGHRLAGRDGVGMADIEGEVWIAGRRSPERTLLAPLAERGLRPQVGHVVAEWVAKAGYVAAGLGATLVPALAAESFRRMAGDVALVPLEQGGVPARAVYAATAEGRTPSPAAQEFERALTAAARRVDAAPG